MAMGSAPILPESMVLMKGEAAAEAAGERVSWGRGMADMPIIAVVPDWKACIPPCEEETWYYGDGWSHGRTDGGGMGNGFYCEYRIEYGSEQGGDGTGHPPSYLEYEYRHGR